MPDAFEDRQADGIAVLQSLSATDLMPVIPGERAPGAPSERTAPRWVWLATGPWLLLGILAVQAALSLRLVWSNTAFQDEALYLWAGHMEWTHWLHGAPIPDFPASFSGAPVIYPPLAALADTFGGLAAARLLSLAFMLGATALLAAMTTRLYGRRAGLLAAAVFAGVCSTQFLGALATYDAMAVFLLALATWLVVRAADVYPVILRTVLQFAAGLAVTLADAAKYASGLFDVVVIAVAALACMKAGRSLRAGLLAGAVTGLTLAAGLLLALKLGGHQYLLGVDSTTLSRAYGTATARAVIFDSVSWVGLVALTALIGVAVSVSRAQRPADWLLSSVLAGAIVLAPANQARIRTFTSLFKHVGFGAWFASVVAGLALSALADAVPRVKQRKAVGVSSLFAAVLMVLGAHLAGTHFAGWPDSSSFIARLRPILRQHDGNILATDGSNNVIEYYLPQATRDHTFYGGYWFGYHDAVSGRFLVNGPAYADAVRQRFFAVIALPFSDPGSPPDAALLADIKTYGGYRMVAVIPYKTGATSSAFRIWVRS